MFINTNWKLGFLMYGMLFGAFYNLGKLKPFNRQQLRRNGYVIIGSLGMIALLVILSFNIIWKEMLSEEILFHSQEVIITIVLFFTALLLLVNALKDKLNQGFNLFQYAFLVFALLFILGSCSEAIGAILTNILAITLGLFAIKIGAETFRFSVLNYGLLIISMIIVCRFFDTNISFVLRGVLFVLVGLGFFIANYTILKKQNRIKNNSKN